MVEKDLGVMLVLAQEAERRGYKLRRGYKVKMAWWLGMNLVVSTKCR